VDPSPRFHTTVRQVNGQIVVVKIAHDDDVPALRHEAAVLAHINVPGVVRVVATGGDDRRFGLATAHAGLHTVHTLHGVPLAGVLALSSHLVGTIASLHAGGLTHGRVDPTHVIVGRTDRAVLCGFRSAGPPSNGAVADDVRQSAAVCAALVGDAVRHLPRRHRRRQVAVATRCLELLHDPGVTAGPLARQLASLLTDAHRPGTSGLRESRSAQQQGGVQQQHRLTQPQGILRQQGVLQQQGLLQPHGHFVGQQPAGNGQDQAIAPWDNEAIEDPGQIIGSQRPGRDTPDRSYL
jgi:hypothetical protein